MLYECVISEMKDKDTGVLILVLMEDALRVGEDKFGRSISQQVLILVLMEDALRGYFFILYNALYLVLILVLMEDALRELILRRIDCQLVTALFSRNQLDFEEKVYLTAFKYTNFPDGLCVRPR